MILEELEEYFLVNKIGNTNKLSISKCGLEVGAQISFPSLGDTSSDEDLIRKSKLHSAHVGDKATLRRELNG